MYVIRNTMYAKPGQCGKLIEKLKTAIPHFEAMGPNNLRVLADAVATTWTIAMEVDSVSTYFDILEGRSPGRTRGSTCTTACGSQPTIARSPYGWPGTAPICGIRGRRMGSWRSHRLVPMDLANFVG